MRTFFCSAVLVAVAASLASAAPVLGTATADGSNGAPGLIGLPAGKGGIDLGLVTAVNQTTGNAAVGGDVSVPDVGELVSPTPAPIELIGAPVPTNPPNFIGGIVGFGGASGGDPGAPASVTAVPLPLAVYGGLVLMLLPVGCGAWRRVLRRSAEA